MDKEKKRHNTDHSVKDRLCCIIIICEIHHAPQIIPRQGWKPLLLPCKRSWWSICESMSCRDGRAGPRGWLWYHPTNDSPRMKRFWQICNTVNKVNCSDYVTSLTKCFCRLTSSSTAGAASLSASRVRQGNALKTVSTEEHEMFLSVSNLQSLYSSYKNDHTYTGCLCPIGPLNTPPPHLWSGDSENPMNRGE